MSEQGQEDPDPNVNFDEKKLLLLITDDKWDEAIKFLGRITLENKTAAVNYKYGNNLTTLMTAAHFGAPLTLIQRLCEIGGKPLIMMATNNGSTALHYAWPVIVLIPTLIL